MLTHDTAAGWSKARRPGDLARATPWGATVPAELMTRAQWRRGQALQLHSYVPWSQVAQQDTELDLLYGQAQPEDVGTGSRWDTVPSKDMGRVVGWDHSLQPFDLRLRLIYVPKPAMKDATTALGFQRSDEHGTRYDAQAERLASLYVPGPGPVAFVFGGRRYTPASSPVAFFDFRYVQPARAIQPVDSGAVVAYGAARPLGLSVALPWGWATPRDGAQTVINYPDYPGTVIVIDPPQEPDILETYMIGNTVTLVVLPDRTPLDATNIKLALDVDSYSWSFSAELFGQTSLNLVRPDVGGQKTVELDINGWVWVFIVESYSRQQQFPSERYSLKGASRSQLLGLPYAPLRSQVNGAPLTARQAAEAELANTGFTLQWDSVNANPPDWTLPAGAFSDQSQTALQVIARIAEAVGGIVRPSRASDEVTVLPRYREAVWFWDAAVMDRIIPIDIITNLGGDWAPKPAWNSCYVSGTTHGVAMDVRRTGSAGDNPAPDVFDDLLTGTEANRHRGICELSKGGDVEIVSLLIPLFHQGTGAPGLVEPGMLCEVRETPAWRGLCLGTEISASGVGASMVKQTLRLERHTGAL